MLSVWVGIGSWFLLFFAAIYLMGFGFIALWWPQRVLKFLLGFASSLNKHRLELLIRLLLGVALLLQAPLLYGTHVLRVIGYVLIVTTLVMALLPWRWHRDFAATSVQRAAPWLRWMGLVALMLGFVLCCILLLA